MIAGIIPTVPKGQHTGKRGPKEKPAEEKRSMDFVVKATPANHARFKAAGGSTWAYNVLLNALKEEKAGSDSPPQGKAE